MTSPRRHPLSLGPSGPGCRPLIASRIATRDVDVATILEIHVDICRLAEEGKAVIVISSYLPEIPAISDRILVARLGRVVAEFDARDRDRGPDHVRGDPLRSLEQSI